MRAKSAEVFYNREETADVTAKSSAHGNIFVVNHLQIAARYVAKDGAEPAANASVR